MTTVYENQKKQNEINSSLKIYKTRYDDSPQCNLRLGSFNFFIELL